MDHYLRSYVPQGLGYWRNWQGSGTTEDIMVVGMHHRDENAHLSLLYGLKANGKKAGTVYLPKGAHAGSVKFYKNWMYVQQNNDMIRRYNVATVRKKFKQPGIPYLGDGTPIRIKKVDVSFFDIFGGYLYAGHFDKDNRDKMVRYYITAYGRLAYDTTWGPVQVPKRTQGLNVTPKTFYFSTSYDRDNRSNIYVVRRGYGRTLPDESSGKLRCFRGPVLSEDIERVGGRLVLSFEGGADYFNDPGGKGVANNRIKSLHTARLSTLHDMVW